VNAHKVGLSAANVFSILTKHLGKRQDHAKWFHTHWIRSVCHLSNYEKIYASLQQYSAVALTTNSSMHCL
jgi:hypothetical protein